MKLNKHEITKLVHGQGFESLFALEVATGRMRLVGQCPLDGNYCINLRDRLENAWSESRQAFKSGKGPVFTAA